MSDTTLNLRYLLTDGPARLADVIRFSTCHKVHHESVAEHSYFTALYAMFVCDWIAINQTTLRYIDRGQVLSNALVHDVEESITGDINRLFKHSLPEIKEAIDTGGEYAVQTIMGHLSKNEPLKEKYRMSWRIAKNDTYSGKIVQFCDYLSVLGYMIRELTNSNVTMRQHWTTMHDYAAIFEEAEFDFIRPLVEDAKELLHEAFASGKV